MSLEQKLERMRERGSSVILTTTENGDEWECSWITGGKRYTVFAARPETAVTQAILAAGASQPTVENAVKDIALMLV